MKGLKMKMNSWKRIGFQWLSSSPSSSFKVLFLSKHEHSFFSMFFSLKNHYELRFYAEGVCALSASD